MNLDQARRAIGRCLALRDNQASEANLREEFLSRLRLIFPDAQDEYWINSYVQGAEAPAVVGLAGGGEAIRFIDNLVGLTTIEYKADLRNPAMRNAGNHQVKEHAAGLIRNGHPVSQVRGILSDTVEWHAYDVTLVIGIDPGNCTADDIGLNEVDLLEIGVDDETTATRLARFLRKHLARQKSRPLVSKNIAFDLGPHSCYYQSIAAELIRIVQNRRNSDHSIELATDLWSRFVDRIEGEDGAFRVSHYVDEIYLNILSRFLSAYALRGEAIQSDDDELRGMLDGSYFRNGYNLNNFVEKDYFGWIAQAPYIDEFLPFARKIQSDLYAYDFKRLPEEDLFGRLMSQLAQRNQRKLLGQEWTPKWLAKHLARRCIENLPNGEEPEIVDMCCGSGAILAEIIKETKTRFNFNDIVSLGKTATGFDIDPLAVAFAKATWVITLAGEIKNATEPVTIPIYHADSLFAVTPVSDALPMLGEAAHTIDVQLDDGEPIQLPVQLLQPEYRELFDSLIDWVYDVAQNQDDDPLTRDNALAALDNKTEAAQVMLPPELREASANAVFALTQRMKHLVDAGRNGIWAFILRNTYRPGLLVGQFNGLVSNPPWLAMSSLAENPYLTRLSRQAELYGVKPAGPAFLHLELSTTYLLHAVDRYLKLGAAVACLVPGTIFNGNHHERFRQRRYLHSQRPVALSINELWHVAPGTFKYPGAALIGKKADNFGDADNLVGAGAIARPTEIETVDFEIRQIGEMRTAWVLEKNGLPAAAVGGGERSNQGADIMPRRAVCVEILFEAGTEYRVNTPQDGSQCAFAVKQAKKLRRESFPGNVAPRFIHRLAQSLNLLPFVFGQHCAHIAIPAVRDVHGAWQIFSSAEIIRKGFANTVRRFSEIDGKLAEIGDTALKDRIDFRRKLTNQNFPENGYLVLSGAGGKHICAACLPVDEEAIANLVIDQTLYWQHVANEDDAWFRTGFLNSAALTEAILPFNPSGNFGQRHIHTLPYRLMPSFDANNSDHCNIAEKARNIAVDARNIVADDHYIRDPNRALHVRRLRLRGWLAENEDFLTLNRLCGSILGLNVGSGNED